MFHTYTRDASGFHDWLVATNRLHRRKHLERGQPLQDYMAIQAEDINTHPQNHFLIFGDDEAGLCGSAAIVVQSADCAINP